MTGPVAGPDELVTEIVGLQMDFELESLPRRAREGGGREARPSARRGAQQHTAIWNLAGTGKMGTSPL